MTGADFTPSVCPVCRKPVEAKWYLCPYCGKNLKEKPPSTTWITQTGLYLLAVFLPPLGLWPGIRYFRYPDENTRRVGIIMIVLTMLSLIVNIWVFTGLFNSVMNQVNKSLQGFSNF